MLLVNFNNQNSIIKYLSLVSLTSLDFKYVKPSLDLIKLTLQHG